MKWTQREKRMFQKNDIFQETPSKTEIKNK